MALDLFDKYHSFLGGYRKDAVFLYLRIFQCIRLVNFIEEFKTRVKNLKIEKIIAFDKHLHELFFAIYSALPLIRHKREKRLSD